MLGILAEAAIVIANDLAGARRASAGCRLLAAGGRLCPTPTAVRRPGERAEGRTSAAVGSPARRQRRPLAVLAAELELGGQLGAASPGCLIKHSIRRQKGRD